MAKLKCSRCAKTCKGEVLKVEDKYYHKACFTCIECSTVLKESNFCTRDGFLYCENHFNQKYGTRCNKCQEFMVGEVITALGKFYHPTCFLCHTCNLQLRAGDKIVDTGKEIYCEACALRNEKERQSLTGTGATTDSLLRHNGSPENRMNGGNTILSPTTANLASAASAQFSENDGGRKPLATVSNLSCGGSATQSSPSESGSRKRISNADRRTPQTPTGDKVDSAGDGIGRRTPLPDGRSSAVPGPLDSLKCEACAEIIQGQLLQAGDKFFHPECGRCIICDQSFKEAEDVYLLGTDIWHSYCAFPRDNAYSFDASHSANTSFFSRGSTPYSSLDRSRHYPYPGGRFDPEADYGAQIYTISYLNPGNDQGYLRSTLPVKTPKSPHFHRPPGRFTYHRDKGRFMIPAKKKGMLAMVENIEETTSLRPKSPNINNEEPIELSHYPAGRKPNTDEMEVPKIEREDWPAPPYGPAVPERKYLWTRPEDMMEEDREAWRVQNEKLKREARYLEKLESGIGKVFLRDLEEKQKRPPTPKIIDPRNASRTPSARREPRLPTRYGSPVWASPSRYTPSKFKRPDDTYLCKFHTYRTSSGLGSGNSDTRSGSGPMSKSSTLPGMPCEDATTEEIAEFVMLNERAKSAEFANMSQQELQADTEGPDQRFMYRGPYVSEMYRMFPHTAHHRRSMPNMSESVKIYPYHLLKTTNRKLPKDIDRTFLERHLALEEFKYLFGCTPIEFYKLPEWRRNLMKKAAKLW